MTLPDAETAARAKEALAGRACGPILIEEDQRTIVVPVVTVERLVPLVIRQLDGAGIPVTDIAARQATLDDVFFALTGHAAIEDAANPNRRR